MQIKVVEGVTRSHGISSYIAYMIKVSTPHEHVIERRYREFDALR